MAVSAVTFAPVVVSVAAFGVTVGKYVVITWPVFVMSGRAVVIVGAAVGNVVVAVQVVVAGNPCEGSVPDIVLLVGNLILGFKVVVVVAVVDVDDVEDV